MPSVGSAEEGHDDAGERPTDGTAILNTRRSAEDAKAATEPLFCSSAAGDYEIIQPVRGLDRYTGRAHYSADA